MQGWLWVLLRVTIARVLVKITFLVHDGLETKLMGRLQTTD